MNYLMNEAFVINGRCELAGELKTRGSKNTALPCIAASLLTRYEVLLENVPDIADVAMMLAIAEDLGAKVSRDKTTASVSIRAKNLSKTNVNSELARKLRGSLLFSGALLGRFKKAEMPYPGGDQIGSRPLGTHFAALRGLGVVINEGSDIKLDGRGLKGGMVILEESSVTATENLMLAAVLAPGTTEIRLAAAEPHIQELARLLNAMGAKIRWDSIGILKIIGVSRLHGAHFRLNPDELEISSFAALAATSNSVIHLRGVEPRYLDAVLLQLGKMGVEYRVSENDLLIGKSKSPYRGFRLQSGLYPKLVSDHLPPFAVLATQAKGESLIHEWLYDNRLRYLDELRKMGANVSILDPHRAVILGPTPLRGTKITSLDVRSGMTLIIAALIAEGETTIADIHHIDRGYERVEERLRQLGADIKRISN